MTSNIRRSAALFLFFSAASFSQTSSVLVTAGYSEVAPFQAAPGQVLTLFYRGIVPAANGELRSDKAQPPLPTLLAGLSAQVIQENSLFNVPIFEVRQQNICDPGLTGPNCLLTSVKVQVPFEIAADVKQDLPSGPVALSPLARLSLYADGQPVASSLLQPVPDNSHVLTTCDSTWDTRAASVCDRQVFHLDGTPVNDTAPARNGETISVFLYGMGQTSPPAATGAAAQPGYFLTGVIGSPRVKVSFNSFVNALASAPRHVYIPDPNDVPAVITGANLESGQVGIYQLNVAVPDSLSPPVSCGGTTHSNYVMNVITSQGAETVPLCVGQ